MLFSGLTIHCLTNFKSSILLPIISSHCLLSKLHSFCSFSSLVYNVLLHDFTTFCTQTHKLILAHVQSYFDYFLVAVISQIAWGKWLYIVYLYPNAMSPHSTNHDDWKNVGSFYYSYGIYCIEPTFFQVFFPILPSFFLWISCALLKNKYSQ